MKLVFASGNVHKLTEIRNLAPHGCEIVSLRDIHFVELLSETKKTLEGNALQKANYLYKKTHLNCFADDTGLEVNALNGAPGVYSARYAGKNKSSEENMVKLLTELQSSKNRIAQFRTIIAAIIDGNKYIFDGIIKGEILHKPKGANGFGYDAVFRPNGHKVSFAEMTFQEKNGISHRAIALKKFFEFLKTKDS
jgi:XTP/dITP diphosphohydrolase